MTTPTLLLSPDESRTRAGAITPSQSGTVTVIAGAYGPAWSIAAGGFVWAALAAGMLPSASGTLVARWRRITTATGYAPLSTGNSGVAGADHAETWVETNGTVSGWWRAGATWQPAVQGGVVAPVGTTVTSVLRWSGAELALWTNGTKATVTGRATAAGGLLGDLTLRGDAAYETVLAYDVALTDEQVARLLTEQRALTWHLLMPSTVTLPAYASAAYRVRPRVYVADRDNARGAEITAAVTACAIDTDIDRQGAKGQVRIAARGAGVLRDGMWIAPCREVTPEVGAITVTQRGLYQLDAPTREDDVTGQVRLDATGQDIVRLMERAVLTEAQVTPHDTPLMDEVARAIELATATLGANLLTNPSLDGATYPPAGWTGFSNNGMAMSAAQQVGSNAHGAHCTLVWNTTVSNGSAGVFVYQGVAIPPGVTRMYGSAWAWSQDATLTVGVSIEFWTAQGGTLLGGGDSPRMQHGGLWHHHRVIADVPDGATWAVLRLDAIHTATSGTNRAVAWDDGHLHPCLGMPISRMALPPSDAKTGPVWPQSQIAHKAGTRWLARINDLLAAAGYHALSATRDGRPTTRPQRDPRTDTPARTYTPGTDARVIGGITVQPATTGVYNVVTALKEDSQDGTYLLAVARNDDPAHPWSTVNRGVIGPPQPITVNDAVDQATLQAIADAALARASLSEAVTLSVLPDETLGVHDVIAVVGGVADGRWAIQSLREGLTAADPLVEIGARRATMAAEATP